MSNLRANFDKVEDYINGELSGQELTEFEEMMSQNESLAEEVRLQELAHEAIVHFKLDDLRKELKQISSNEKKFSKYKKYFAAGAIALSLILASVYLYKISRTNVHNVQEVSPNTSLSEEIEYGNKNKSNIVEKDIEKAAFSASKNETGLITKSQAASLVQKDTLTKAESLRKEEPFNIIANDIVPPSPDLRAEHKTQANIDPCLNTKIDAYIHIEASCKNETSGKITIDQASIKGGTPSYQFSLNEQDFQSFPSFENLQAGNILLFIKDANGCISQKNVLIKEKECMKETAIYPLRGETWQVPLIDTKMKLTVKDQSGNVVFESEFTDIDNFAWDGRNSSGQDLPMGNYIYTIKGASGKLNSGYISIFR